MDTAVGLGRVAVLDGGEGARRVLRALHELARAGQAGVAVAVHGARDRLARFVREADEAVEMDGPVEQALRAARAAAAWLGPASLEERATFAEACARAGVAHIGPPAAALRRLTAPGGLAALASSLGIGAADPSRPDPRMHLVEVVVARDARGTARALGVGDASLRRDGVAVLAESPSPALTASGDSAARDLGVRACTSAGWTGICAVQLLVDPQARGWALVGLDAFAHSAPAVEALAGVDLVQLALLIAAGAPLGHDMATHGHEVATHGHSFAARILARDPEAGPGPTVGRVEVLRLPSGLGVRADVAVGEGDEVTAPDGVLATVVTRAASRREAAHRLEQALADGDVLLRGSASSKAWLLALLARPEVRAGEATVGLLDKLASSGERLVRPQREAALVVAAIQAYHAEADLERARFIAEARRGRARVGPSAGRVAELRYAGHRYRLDVRQVGPHEYSVSAAGSARVDVHLERLSTFERRLVWQGRRHRVLSVADGLQLLVQVDGVGHAILRDPSGIVASPMPAVVVAIPVEPGQQVAAGDPVARIESMKVEVEVRAPMAGVVREIQAAVNGQVDAGGPLVRLEPLTREAAPSAEHEPEPLALGLGAPEPTETGERYLRALTQLLQLLLGFDVAPADARKLAAAWREAWAAAPGDDRRALRLEEWAVTAFADLQCLFSRARGPDGGRPPLEELWRYLHEPEARGEGLSARFVAMLRRALAYYGVSMEAPGSALELALLRLQKAHDRVGDQLPPILAILERRLASGQLPPASEQAWRDVLERLAVLGQERFPALADLAREVRYRSFDQPAFERVRSETYAQAEADVARLAVATGPDRRTLVRRLVECPQSLITLLGPRMANPESAPLRPVLVETLLRRYYRFRPLESVTALEHDGLPCAWSDYERDGQRFRLVACFALAGDAAQAARKLARLASDRPEGSELIAEAYLWNEGPLPPSDELAESMRSAFAEAALPRPLRRATVVLAMPGLGKHSQQHFTFRDGPDGLVEDRPLRGVHPMLFERLQLGRLAKFDLERLPSVEDVYLYHAVARSNPKDERLFAMAEVRDLSAVRDPRGELVQVPQLEHMFHEALAGMRLFQARRAPTQRLEWNRVILTLAQPLELSREEIRALAERLMSATEGLGLEMVLITARVPDPTTGDLRETLVRIIPGGQSLRIRWDAPADRPLEPMAEYQQKVVQLRRRGLTHPFELVKMLAPPADVHSDVPPGDFVEYDLDDASGALVPVERPPGKNTANVVVGVIRSFTPSYPEGMKRVIVLGDPGREMGSVAEPECRRIVAALDLAEQLGAPLEWLEVCAGAKISMTTGTENMDWVSAVLRRLIEFTQRGGEVNVLVLGVTVGAQPYWNAEATMLMHTRGILVMAPGSSMVLTGKQALEYSGSVSAEDNEGIGGYDRIMGPNGQAQYQAGSVAEACQILLRHYEHCYVAPGERFPRRAPTSDPRDRDVRPYPHGPEGGAGFTTVGDIFSAERNPDRKKPFEIRHVMAAAIDQDHSPLERWRDMRGGDTGVVWDAHLGGWPVCLIGIQSRPLPRLEFVPADGPEFWSAGTLFPQSSKKLARAINAASRNRPLVVLANLSGFDGSPESMRRLQLEYGAEIGRAVVNFDGPIVFTVVSRYHGGAFVVFAKTLTPNIEIAAVEGARASVIGGAPAAAVVFAREVETRTRKDPRVAEAEKAASAGGAARGRLADVLAAVRSEKLGEVGDEFDAIHSVERALKVGSLDRIIAAKDLRPYLIDALERGMARFTARSRTA